MNFGEVISTDLLVIGGGASGLAAAIKAKGQPIEVLVVDKGGTGWAGQVPLSGGRIMVLSPDMDRGAWVKWTVEEGEFLSNQDWTWSFAQDSYGCIQEVAGWGLPFLRNERGEVEISPRSKQFKMVQMIAAKFMLKLKQFALRKGCKTLDRVMVAHLIKDDGEVVGAAGFSLDTGQPVMFKAKATLIATGSCRYKRQPRFDMCCGEGVAMAYKAGAQLANAEFSNTYGYTLKDYEVFTRDPFYLFFENAAGKRIIAKHYPDLAKGLQFSTEDQDYFKIVDAMAREAMAGRGPIVLNLADASPEEREAVANWRQIHERLQRPIFIDMYRVLKEKGNINILKDKVEVVPMFVGGQGPVVVNLDCKTTVGRLWATGDAASLGCGWTGARSSGTRPSWGIAYALVSGLRGGADAGRFASRAGEPHLPPGEVEHLKEIFAPLQRKKGPDPREAIDRIHDAVVPLKYNFYREERNLNQALQIVREASAMAAACKAANPHELAKGLEAEAMALNATFTLRSALMRTETRGTHRREDCPHRDDANWLRWITIQRHGDEMRFSTEPVPIEGYKFQP